MLFLLVALNGLVSECAVSTGLQQLQSSGWALLAGKTVGVVSNPTGIFPNLSHMVDVMHTTPGLNLIAVFGPEHGFRGDQQAGSSDAYFIDPQTGLPVYSIYGQSGVTLQNTIINSTATTIVFDIQDVGTRFYTYIWTMYDVMCAVAALGPPYEMIVLDRPNPIGGATVSGPVLQPGFESGIGELPIALNYGMTAGELALMFAKHFLPMQGLKVNLTVVPMVGWTRGMTWAQTGLPWVLPSPNMPTVDTALVYGGFGMFEGTNCSDGRGTTRPFEIIGAPFITIINNQSIADYLNLLSIPGARFREAYFQPTFDRYVGMDCAGTQVYIFDSNTFDPIYTAIAWMIEARTLYGDAFAWEPPSSPTSPYYIDLMAGTDAVRLSIDAGKSADDIQAAWQPDLQAFISLRSQFLLY